MDITVHDIFDEASDLMARCGQHSGGMLEAMAMALIACFETGGRVLICGNGGSAAEAQHFAAEFVNKLFVKRRALPAMALTTDTSALTSIGNDMAFQEIFARQVEALGRSGDIIWGLSTSGRSPNVMRAFAAAKALGLTCIAFCGSPGSDLEARADMALTVASDNTARIQEVHLLAGHALCQLVEHHFSAKG